MMNRLMWEIVAVIAVVAMALVIASDHSSLQRTSRTCRQDVRYTLDAVDRLDMRLGALEDQVGHLEAYRAVDNARARVTAMAAGLSNMVETCRAIVMSMTDAPPACATTGVYTLGESDDDAPEGAEPSTGRVKVVYPRYERSRPPERQ